MPAMSEGWPYRSRVTNAFLSAVFQIEDRINVYTLVGWDALSWSPTAATTTLVIRDSNRPGRMALTVMCLGPSTTACMLVR